MVISANSHVDAAQGISPKLAEKVYYHTQLKPESLARFSSLQYSPPPMSRQILQVCLKISPTYKSQLHKEAELYCICRGREQLSAMSASIPGNRDLPASQYDLKTYWGRVRQSADLADPR